MKIAILSRNTRLYSTSRLVAAARARGHRVRVLDPLRCYMRIAHDGFALHFLAAVMKGIDCVLPPLVASIRFYAPAGRPPSGLVGAESPSPSAAAPPARATRPSVPTA